MRRPDLPPSELLWPHSRRERWLLLLILAAGLLLRLLVWRWRELYPLGGDETEYFNQALTLLRGEGYRELRLMRPPLYPAFLAAVFQLFDSQVQRVRLVQALISTASIYLQWLLARLALDPEGQQGEVPLLAAAFVAASYTLAANATELLTETTFVFGLTLVLCLLLAASPSDARAGWLAAAAGISTGLLALLRSVALPLLPLGALWLLFSRAPAGWQGRGRWRIGPTVIFLVAAALVVVPWSARNYMRYRHLIVVDTTGAENLWLDNDPAGREAVKTQLYALGEDRGQRQALAMQRGLEVVRADPARFARKVAAEARKLAALEYWDDMRARPSIWVPQPEVWLRLLLGDGIWLVLALAGTVGLALLQPRLQLLFVPWALYVVATNLVFHVELRYRLPLYPVLALSAAGLLASTDRSVLRPSTLRYVAGVGSAILICGLMLLHRPYHAEGAMLGVKHWSLWRGDGSAALRLDPTSALARVRLARAELEACGSPPAACPAAEALLVDAIGNKPDHPYPHLLSGGLLRERGETDQARTELAYETASLEDLQRWMVDVFGPRAVDRVDVGDGLDLGNVVGFHPATDNFRWTRDEARVWIAAPRLPARLQLNLAHGRPPEAGAATLPVRIRASGRELARLEVGPEWATYEVALPADLATTGGILEIAVAAPTFRPRQYDPAADDNRVLGVKVDWAAVVPTTP